MLFLEKQTQILTQSFVQHSCKCVYPSLKMFKTAFPPGWIGKHKKLSQNFKYQIWIESQIDLEFNNDDLTKRELSLINILRLKGKWQSELLRFGFNSTIINSMVSKKLLIKTKRKKIVSTKLSSFKNDCIKLKRPNLTQEQKKYMGKCKRCNPEMSLCYGEKQVQEKQKFI